jgi:hypothetical protein
MTATLIPAPVPAASVQPTATCPNCNAPGLLAYCATCGQKRPEHGDLTMGALATHAFDEILSADSRVISTLRSLVVAPGEVIRDWFEGRRARWVAPLRLYLVTSALYYFSAYDLTQDAINQPFLDLTAKIASDVGTMTAAEARANASAHMENLTTAISFAAVLLQAMLAKLFLRSTRRTYAEHVIAMLYSTAPVWMLSTVVLTAWWWVGDRALVGTPTTLVAFVAFAYFVVVLQRAYALRWLRAVVAGAAIYAGTYLAESMALLFAAGIAAFIPV